METTHETRLVMPANCVAIDQNEAAGLEGGGFLLTALGLYGAYSAYNSFNNYVKNNTQAVQSFQKSLAASFSSFLNVFEKFAVLKVSFDIFRAIF